MRTPWWRRRLVVAGAVLAVWGVALLAGWLARLRTDHAEAIFASAPAQPAAHKVYPSTIGTRSEPVPLVPRPYRDAADTGTASAVTPTTAGGHARSSGSRSVSTVSGPSPGKAGQAAGGSGSTAANGTGSATTQAAGSGAPAPTGNTTTTTTTTTAASPQAATTSTTSTTTTEPAPSG